MSEKKSQTGNHKLVALIGPTSSGKSELAVKLARQFNAEIISADSRQVYRGFDLGTGKVAGSWMKNKFVYKGVVHHCIDFVNPLSHYSVALFQRDAKKIISDILGRGKLPLICGGTAQWVDSIVYNQQIPDVKPNPKLRAKLEEQSAMSLFRQISLLDPRRAKTIDAKNKRRLVRALEIIKTTKKPVPEIATKVAAYDVLWLGTKTKETELYKKIDLRLKRRLKQGMVKEVMELHQQGLSWKHLENFGLEYKYTSLYLRKRISSDQMLTQLSFAIKHYSKRQLTWWKKNKEIIWLDDIKSAPKIIANFLK